MILLSISAGRLVVEKKLLDGMNEKKREEFAKKIPIKMFNKDVDEIKMLAEDERSEMWRPGLIMYGIALPLVWLSFILFYFTEMSKDIHCTVAQLGDSGHDPPFYNDTTDHPSELFLSMCLN